MSPRMTGKYEIKSWDEKPYFEGENGAKLTRASITESIAGDFEGNTSTESLMCYSEDGAASYVSLMRFVGRIGDRSGSFVEQSTGTYDGTQASSTSVVVPGSGTDGFKGMTGRGSSVSTHDDYPFRPFTLDYEFE
jgi:Protein of unknown function (DUF3224)